jgi:hypothetical protein
VPGVPPRRWTDSERTGAAPHVVAEVRRGLGTATPCRSWSGRSCSASTTRGSPSHKGAPGPAQHHPKTSSGKIQLAARADDRRRLGDRLLYLRRPPRVAPWISAATSLLAPSPRATTCSPAQHMSARWASDHVASRTRSAPAVQRDGQFPAGRRQLPQALTALALVAGVTEHPAETTILVLPHRHPLAAKTGDLDHLSGGRVILGTEWVMREDRAPGRAVRAGARGRTGHPDHARVLGTSRPTTTGGSSPSTRSASLARAPAIPCGSGAHAERPQRWSPRRRVIRTFPSVRRSKGHPAAARGGTRQSRRLRLTLKRAGLNPPGPGH